MRLERTNPDFGGTGKYALVNMRKVRALEGVPFSDTAKAIKTLLDAGVLEYGKPGSAEEFFVIKLRDEFAEPALVLYANTAMLGGEKEYARDVMALANRSARSPHRKRPD